MNLSKSYVLPQFYNLEVPKRKKMHPRKPRIHFFLSYIIYTLFKSEVDLIFNWFRGSRSIFIKREQKMSALGQNREAESLIISKTGDSCWRLPPMPLIRFFFFIRGGNYTIYYYTIQLSSNIINTKKKDLQKLYYIEINYNRHISQYK